MFLRLSSQNPCQPWPFIISLLELLLFNREFSSLLLLHICSTEGLLQRYWNYANNWVSYRKVICTHSYIRNTNDCSKNSYTNHLIPDHLNTFLDTFCFILTKQIKIYSGIYFFYDLIGGQFVQCVLCLFKRQFSSTILWLLFCCCCNCNWFCILGIYFKLQFKIQLRNVITERKKSLAVYHSNVLLNPLLTIPLSLSDLKYPLLSSSKGMFTN